MPLTFRGNVFDTAFEALMRAEGGATVTNTAADPGGWTKWGVTLRTLREWRKDPTLGPEAIQGLTVDEAKKLCFEMFYKPLGLELCENLPICIILLNQAYNRGVAAVNGEVHGILAIKLNPSFPTVKDILNFYWSEFDKLPRLTYDFCIHYLVGTQKNYLRLVKENPKLAVFLTGWLNRTHDLFQIVTQYQS